MPEHSHEELRRVFDLALSAASDQRGSVLDRECGGDESLRMRVEAMVAAAEDDRFLAAPTSDVRPTSSPADATIAAPLREGPGTRIGAYKILQLIGEGGFGSVFMAQQEQPVQRKVALKIIKLGMDTRQVVARFEQERQALAMMDHPNIARVLDAGATEAGRPFFVMELVKGDPIVEYCDKHRLGIQDRLGLFAQVCAAVQHAHTKGIIHRDIKPSNVLVSTQDGRAFAKVIDFGIAKATSAQLTEKTLFTEHRQLIGTPEYMSPEQAEGSLDLDTRTDVYSLGVLLYELLTGSTPFDPKSLRSAAYAEMQRIIREVDPPAPSTRIGQSAETLANVASQRHVEPRKLGVIVRGELDWIVMKALEKDRQRRYETANGLAMDVQRYLNGDAVVAAPPSTAYRMRKFVRRHRAGVVTAAMVAVALVLGVLGTTWGMVQAGRQRNVAQQAEKNARAEAERATQAEQKEKRKSEELEQVARFQAEQLGTVDASVMGVGLQTGLINKVREAALNANMDQEAATARADEVQRLVAGTDFTGLAFDALEGQFIKPSLAAIDKQFKDQPLVRARLLESLAKASLDIGINRSMTEAHKEALDIRRRLLGDDDPATIEAIRTAGWLEMKASHFDASEKLLREAMERSARVLGEKSREHIGDLSALAIVLGKESRDSEAAQGREKAYELARSSLGEEDPKTLDIKLGCAISQMFDGHPELAEVKFREVLDSISKVNPPDSNALAAPLNWLSICLMNEGKTEEGEPFSRRGYELNLKNLGADHPTTLSSLNTLGWIHRKLHRYDEAERELTEAYERRKRLVGEIHQDTLASLRNLGQVALDRGQYEKAEDISRRSLEGFRRLLGNRHLDTIWAETILARSLTAVGRYDEAEVLFREAASANEEFPGPMSVPLLNAMILLADKFAETSKFERATKLLLDMNEQLKVPASVSKNGEKDSATYRAKIAAALARTFDAWNKADPGKGYDAKAVEWKTKAQV